VEEAPDLDEVLARRVSRGDRAAEGALCGRLYPRVRAFARLRLREPAEAADFAQQVMVVVLRALRADRVADVAALGAFVHGVCKTTHLAWRRGDRRRDALLAQLGEELVATTRIPDEAVDLGKAADCFRRLAPRAQAVVALSVIGGSESDDVARELGTTPGNVRVLRHRALRALHDCVTAGGA
jgi:RNA polymerase sigma-70 factor (ECF subfamily)